MWYGSAVSLHGSARPLRSYHDRRDRRKARRRVVAGSSPVGGVPVFAFFLRILAGMKIYTRTGDAGETSLLGGTRVSKADPRVAAYGDVDELNACLGAVRAQAEIPPDVAALLERLQRDLFAIGAKLADPASRLSDRSAKTAVTDADIARLESAIDLFESELPPLRRFILPGGSRAGALLHLSRTVCRRTERGMVALGIQQTDPLLVVYVNRLSDLLFVLARAVNHRAGQLEMEW
jgi:cob(I)alamin adenosyltransferase